MEKVNEMKNAGNAIHNLDVLGLPADHKRVRILWMYPNSLHIHGGRGDLMALLRFATMAKLPIEICRVDRLTDEIPLENAHMLYFCCGELECAADIVKALESQKEALFAFAEAGNVIVANGSTGAILGKDLKLADGTVIPCLGLLGMHSVQRTSIHGDDLWLDAIDGIEVIGNEIKRMDVTLDPEQAPFGTVRYGRGNCGDGKEGAVTRNVIYTTCLGPLLVRNPALAMALLRRAAMAADMQIDEAQFALSPEAILHESKALEETRIFIRKKMEKK